MTATGWILLLLAVLPSIVLHEVSHGFVANLCGDPTAKNAGRLTLNPVKHIDPIGTVLIPVVLVLSGLPPFGFAKPVPVNVNRLRHPRNQSVWVSLAGPATNIVLSGIALILGRIFIPTAANQIFITNNFQLFLIDFGFVNLLLALINLLPIPPLDGSALLERMVPRKHLGRYFQLRANALPFALIILIVLRVSGVGNGVIGSLQQDWLRLLLH